MRIAQIQLNGDAIKPLPLPPIPKKIKVVKVDSVIFPSSSFSPSLFVRIPFHEGEEDEDEDEDVSEEMIAPREDAKRFLFDLVTRIINRNPDKSWIDQNALIVQLAARLNHNGLHITLPYYWGEYGPMIELNELNKIFNQLGFGIEQEK